MTFIHTSKDGFFTSRDEFCQFCHLIYERGLAAGTGGNVSVRCGEHIWLTPSGFSLRDTAAEKICVVNGKGDLIEGDTPTKEAGMHLGVFHKRPNINVVLHLHGPYIIAATTLLESGPDALPALTPGFTYHAYPLPMIPFMAPGSPGLAEAVAEALAERGTSAVLLKNHGLVTLGRDFSEALNIAEEIDEAARVYVLTGGKAPAIGPEHIDAIRSLRSD